MSRRFVGNRRELLSALGGGGGGSATPKRRANAARRVRGIVYKEGINGQRNTIEEVAAATAAVDGSAAAPVRKRQRLAKARAMPSTTTTSMTNPRPAMVMMKTMLATTRRSRDLNFSARSYATEQAPQAQAPQAQAPPPPSSSSLPPLHSPHTNGPYDPSVELKNYTGSRAYLEIQAVLQGQISLETARVQRLHNLMALLNNVDQVKRQLRDEDMAGDPAALDARMAAFLAERERTVDLWRREAQARQKQQRQRQRLQQYNDPDTAMVHPAHVPGRRMGPAENEQQRQELDRLVQAQAAMFQVRPLPLSGRRVVAAAAAGARAGPGSFGAAQQQTRLFSTASQLRPLITTIRQRSFFWTTAASAFHSSHGRRTTATSATSTTTTDQAVSKPKAKSKPKPKPQPTSTSASTAKSKSKSKYKPRQSAASPTTHNPSKPKPRMTKPNPDPTTPTPTPAWAIQKQALAAKFGTEGWSPRRKLSPDAMLHLRALHTANPQLYTTQLLATTFKQSPEAIRRILKSKWLSERATPDAVQARRDRWARRHDRIWDVKSELGLRPKRTRDRHVEDASQAAERVEADLWAEAVLNKARHDPDGQQQGGVV